MNEKETACADDCSAMGWVFRLLIFAQVILVGVIVFTTSANYQWYIWLVQAIGIGIGVWALFTMGRFFSISPKLKEAAPLRTGGPYRFVRHPMYLALMIFCGAFVVGDFSIHAFSALMALLLVLSIKVHYEERILRSRFSDYPNYSQKTKRIVPFLF